MISSQRVVGALLKIHHAGVVHNDFTDRHIIAKELADLNPERPWYPMIVDFGEAKMDHNCPYKDNKVETYIRAPSRADFKCAELYVECRDTAQLWHSSKCRPSCFSPSQLLPSRAANFALLIFVRSR